MKNCWVSRVCSQAWNSRAAFGMRCAGEDAGRARDGRRALGRIDRLDRLAGFLQQHDAVFVAVGHHGALAERQLLRRIGRGLHLHHALLRQLLEIFPAQFAHHLEGRGHDGAAIGGMALDHLAGPFRDRAGRQSSSARLPASPDWCCRRSTTARSARSRTCRRGRDIPGEIFGDVFGDERRQPAVLLPRNEMRGVRAC